MTQNRDDPSLAPLAEIILQFPWGNYGLDDVGFIEPEYADYAWDLAAKIQEHFHKPLDATPTSG